MRPFFNFMRSCFPNSSKETLPFSIYKIEFFSLAEFSLYTIVRCKKFFMDWPLEKAEKVLTLTLNHRGFLFSCTLNTFCKFFLFSFFFFLFSFFHSLSLFGHCIWQRNKSQILICLSLTFNLFVCYLFFEALFVLLCCQCHAHYLALTWSSICCVFWPAFMHTKMLS